MIKKFVWSDEYNMESEAVNEQHRHFFEIANKVVDIVNDDKTDRSILFGTICQLGDYAIYHLDEEEKILKKSNDPSAQAHVEDHKLFREKVKEFIDRGRSESEDMKKLANEVVSFLMTWITNHILTIKSLS